MKRFLQELTGHLRHAGWTSPVVLRCDSGFWSKTVIEFCDKNRREYSITVRQTASIRRLIDDVAPNGDNCQWHPLADYPDSGYCEIAETDYDNNPTRRLVVRRVRLLGTKQQALFPTSSPLVSPQQTRRSRHWPLPGSATSPGTGASATACAITTAPFRPARRREDPQRFGGRR